MNADGLPNWADDEFLEAQEPPAGFRLREDGVYYEVRNGEDEMGEEKSEWRKLCSPIRVLAMTRGPDGKGWGRLVEIEDPDGRRHRWAIPAEMFAGDGRELRSECMRLGVQLEPGQTARETFSRLLSKWTPKARATTTERLGWADETCSAFVLGSGDVIGDESIVFQSASAPGSAAEMRGMGTLDEWKASVGAACIGNPIMVLAVSLAFSGALLELMKLDGGGLHLRGQSSRGKSTILRAAVSVWGSPRFMQSWRATSNGLEGAAAACNGSLVALDEMGEIAAREAGATAYMLANGQGKARAARSGTARPSARWRTAILSSGEISLADKMAEAGQRARAGHEVRLLDMQADGQAFGAFDDLHGEKDPAVFAQAVGQMAAGAYGTAGPAFVERLVSDHKGALSAVRRHVEEFRSRAADALGPPEEGQTSRAVDRFAIIAAAGELATEWGITGWPKGAAIEAAREALHLWIEGRGGAGPAEDREAIDRTREFIIRHGDARFEGIGDKKGISGTTIRDRAGWTDGELFFIASDIWAREVHAGADPKRAARAVKHAGYLVTDAGPSRLTRKTPRGVEGRPRCYCVSVEILGGNVDAD